MITLIQNKPGTRLCSFNPRLSTDSPMF